MKIKNVKIMNESFRNVVIISVSVKLKQRELINIYIYIHTFIYSCARL